MPSLLLPELAASTEEERVSRQEKSFGSGPKTSLSSALEGLQKNREVRDEEGKNPTGSEEGYQSFHYSYTAGSAEHLSPSFYAQRATVSSPDNRARGLHTGLRDRQSAGGLSTITREDTRSGRLFHRPAGKRSRPTTTFSVYDQPVRTAAVPR
jgi:hypothetical protein